MDSTSHVFLCSCCSSTLGDISILCFYLKTEYDVLLTIKNENLSSFTASGTFTYGEYTKGASRKHRLLCRRCSNPLGYKISLGPSNSFVYAFGPDKVIVYGQNLSGKDKWRNLWNKNPFSEVETRTDRTFFINNLQPQVGRSESKRVEYRQNEVPRTTGRGSARSTYDRKRNIPSSRLYIEQLIESADRTICEESAALKFIQGMKRMEPVTDLLFYIVDEKKYGLKRIREIMQLCGDAKSIDKFLLPVLHILFADPTLSQPLNVRSRDRILISIYQIPFLVNLVSQTWRELTYPGSNEIICQFLRISCSTLLEARSSEDIRNIAREMQEIGVKGVDILSTILMLESHQPLRPTGDKVDIMPVCWTSDMRPPGGRHNNDFPNYRDISIVPTADEITSEEQSYLPLADGSNVLGRGTTILEDTASLLDSQFRLLREDFVQPIRNEINTNKKLIEVRAVDYYSALKSPGHPCVVFRLKYSFNSKGEYIKGEKAKAFWEKFQGLEIGTLVCFCRETLPIRYGKVEMSYVDSTWLLHEDGPRIGISFERPADTLDALSEIGNSCITNCQLLSVSQSFFSYKHTLEVLQRMVHLPFAEEIVRQENTAITPEYMPYYLKLPKDFNEVDINVRDLDTESLLRDTTLDASQVNALHLALTNRVALVQGPPGA